MKQPLTDRRSFLRAAAAGSIAGLAGCSMFDSESVPETAPVNEMPELMGSGYASREPPEGPSMRDMPPLGGTLTVYSGRGSALVGDLLEYIRELYPDLDLHVRYGGSSELVDEIVSEGEESRGDVFYSVNAGALGSLADQNRTRSLPNDILGMIPAEFSDPDGHWVGTSGRARAVPYNTDRLDESDVPDDIFAFPDYEPFENNFGWAPSYGSFQAFVTAMRLRKGRERTKEWLESMIDHGTETYPDEFFASQHVADGEIVAGLANHYYTLRVQAARPDAPIALIFTENDAGAIFNVAGACVLDTASNPEMATRFVRHLLSAEAQDYFARRTFEYPLLPSVEPVGDLPPVDELSVPEGVDLAQLSNLEPALELIRSVGLET